jgi:hypothetical protein
MKRSLNGAFERAFLLMKPGVVTFATGVTIKLTNRRYFITLQRPGMTVSENGTPSSFARHHIAVRPVAMRLGRRQAPC